VHHQHWYLVHHRYITTSPVPSPSSKGPVRREPQCRGWLQAGGWGAWHSPPAAQSLLRQGLILHLQQLLLVVVVLLLLLLIQLLLRVVRRWLVGLLVLASPHPFSSPAEPSALDQAPWGAGTLTAGAGPPWGVPPTLLAKLSLAWPSI